MTHKVKLHPLAEDEFLATYYWYSERSETAARAFLREMDRAVRRISEAPERWQKYDSVSRRFLLRKFPFSVIYRVTEQVVEVIAVAHSKRKPDTGGLVYEHGGGVITSRTPLESGVSASYQKEGGHTHAL